MESGSDLMLVSLFALADILLRLFVKGFLAPSGAEVVGLAVVLRGTSRGCGVNIHATYGVMHCICHMILSFPLV